MKESSSKSINTKNVNIDEYGRVIISDKTLHDLEKSFEPTAASRTTNDECGGYNSGCDNISDCSNSTNSACSNSTVCEGSEEAEK